MHRGHSEPERRSHGHRSKGGTTLTVGDEAAVRHGVVASLLLADAHRVGLPQLHGRQMLLLRQVSHRPVHRGEALGLRHEQRGEAAAWSDAVRRLAAACCPRTRGPRAPSRDSRNSAQPGSLYGRVRGPAQRAAAAAARQASGGTLWDVKLKADSVSRREVLRARRVGDGGASAKQHPHGVRVDGRPPAA